MRFLKKIKTSAGFSLVEILVAVGILAGAVATMMPMVEVSAMLSVEDQKMLKAVTLANSKMVELERDILADIDRGKFPDETTETGIFDSPFQDYSWEFTLTKVEIPLSEQAGQEEDGENQSAAVVSALSNIMKEISKAVRELKVVVRWEGRDEDQVSEFSITTHVVNIK